MTSYTFGGCALYGAVEKTAGFNGVDQLVGWSESYMGHVAHRTSSAGLDWHVAGHLVWRRLEVSRSQKKRRVRTFSSGLGCVVCWYDLVRPVAVVAAMCG